MRKKIAALLLVLAVLLGMTSFSTKVMAGDTIITAVGLTVSWDFHSDNHSALP